MKRARVLNTALLLFLVAGCVRETREVTPGNAEAQSEDEKGGQIGRVFRYNPQSRKMLIDIGKKHLTPGSRIAITRGAEEIGQGTIETVYANTSSVKIDKLAYRGGSPVEVRDGASEAPDTVLILERNEIDTPRSILKKEQEVAKILRVVGDTVRIDKGARAGAGIGYAVMIYRNGELIDQYEVSGVGLDTSVAVRNSLISEPPQLTTTDRAVLFYHGRRSNSTISEVIEIFAPDDVAIRGGTAHGFSKGSALGLFRGAQTFAILEVTDADTNFCRARVKNWASGDPKHQTLKVGDKVAKHW